jgi:hypothetical protein
VGPGKEIAKTRALFGCRKRAMDYVNEDELDIFHRQDDMDAFYMFLV